MVGLAFYAYEREVGVLCEGGDESFWCNEGGYAGEVGIEEGGDGGGVFGEGSEVRGGEEERACE